MTNKINILELFCYENNPTFICLSEHWLCDSKFETVQVAGYKGVSSFCRKNSTHGGTAIYVRDDIISNSKNLKYITDMSIESCIECAAIEFNRTLCIITIYRAPTGSFNDFLNKLTLILGSILKKYSFLILCGDLNIDFLNHSSQHTKLLFDLLESFQLYSLIKEPTRIAKYGNKITTSGIDYIITNIGENMYHKIIEPGISDHLGQLLTWNNVEVNQRPKTAEIISRKYNEHSVSEFKTLFADTRNFEFHREFIDIDHMFNCFISHFNWCFNVAFPKQKIKINKNVKHNFIFSASLLKELNNLKSLNWLRKSVPDNLLNEQYKLLKKKINKNIESEKKEYYAKKINMSNNKVKTLWSITNEKLGRSKYKEIELNIKIQDNIISSSKEITNLFGEYFANSVKNQIDQLNLPGNTHTTMDKINHNSMFFTPITQLDVKKIILELKNKNSTGIDEIPTKLISECCDEISYYLAEIINVSVQLGQFPTELKISKVIPVFKKGDPLFLENYRGICLLSSFSKIIERAVYENVIKYLNNNNILTPCQHGFRQNYSIETASIDLIQYIYENIDNKNYVLGIFFDFSRAFETINPIFLKEKIEKMGIRGPVNQWIISYVKNRRLKVKIGSEYSDSYETELGTPQGGVLGPLLFLLYINDLPSYIQDGRVFMYADDTTIVVTAKSYIELNEKVISVINNFNQWSRNNHLINNISKTVIIEFKSKYNRPSEFEFNIDNTIIKSSTSTKFLGTIVDYKLDFCENVGNLCNRLNKLFFAFLTLKANFHQSYLLNMYYAFIYPVLSCNIAIWGQATDINRLFIIQKRILRLIFNIAYRDSCRPTFQNNNILTIYSIYLYKLLCYVFLHLNDFKKINEVHLYPTRNNENIYLSNFNYIQFKKSPKYAGGFFFNLLPINIKNSPSYKKFKTNLREYLNKHAFYSLNEYVQKTNENNS